MVLTYQNGENSIRFSNGEQTKYVEFIHGGLLRIYTEKNSEELVKLDYKKQNVAYKVVELGNNLIVKFGNNELLVDETLTFRFMRDGQAYFEEYAGEETQLREISKDFALAKLEGHKEEEGLSGLKTQINIRLFDDSDKIYGLGDKTAQLNRRDFEYISWNTDDPTAHNELYKSLYKSINYLMVNHH